MTVARAFAEAVHPSGIFRSVQGVGGSCPDWIDTPADPDGADADVVIFAPTPVECRRRGWLERAIDRSVRPLAPEGVLYLLAPPRWRWRILIKLRRLGLEIGSPIIPIKSGEAFFYVPLAACALQFAIESWAGSRRWRALLSLLRRFPSAAGLLATLLPAVGFPVHARNVVPFVWLKSRMRGASCAHVLLATSWRGPEGGAVAFGFEGNDAAPSAVAKRPGADERILLNTVAAGAMAAGMEVPRELGPAGPGEWLVESAVTGSPLSRLLADGRANFTEVLDGIASWLAQWNARTLALVELTPEIRNQELLLPARRLEAEIADGPAYLRWLEAKSDGLLGRHVAMVATHNDLTMANLLRGPSGRMALVDWETARPSGLPLADFWYASCDAVAATRGYDDRPAAFEQCFAEQGAYRQLVLCHEAKLRKEITGQDGWIELSFHACWLQHAANELASSRPGDERPFLAIANALVNRSRL
jgi:hypothetical protein